MTCTYPAKLRLPVVDPGPLVEALALLHRAHGSQQGAARALGISQGHFSQLRRGRVGRGITRRLYLRIGEELERAGIDPETPRYQRFLAAIAGPAEREAMRSWWEWLVRAWRQVAPGYPDPDINQSPWCRLYFALPSWIKSYTEPYRRRWERAGHENQRIWLAIARVLAPLAAHVETGGIERAWQELARSKRGRTNDLAIYLKGALLAEDVLLRREPHPLRRAHGTTTQPFDAPPRRGAGARGARLRGRGARGAGPPGG